MQRHKRPEQERRPLSSVVATNPRVNEGNVSDIGITDNDLFLSAISPIMLNIPTTPCATTVPPGEDTKTITTWNNSPLMYTPPVNYHAVGNDPVHERTDPTCHEAGEDEWVRLVQGVASPEYVDWTDDETFTIDEDENGTEHGFFDACSPSIFDSPPTQV